MVVGDRGDDGAAQQEPPAAATVSSQVAMSSTVQSAPRQPSCLKVGIMFYNLKTNDSRILLNLTS